jgi:hypothetical protein
MEPNPREKEAVIEWQEIPNEDVAIHYLRACRNERRACQETTEASLERKEPASDKMESEAEHWEAPEKDAIVKPVEGQKKRHKGRKQAAGRRREPKELSRGDCGSRRKLAAAFRKVSQRATVAWRKRNIFRTSWTQGYNEPRRKLAACRKMTLRADVARRKGNFVRKYSARDNVERETRKGRTGKNRR